MTDLYITMADYIDYRGEDIDDFERYAQRACQAVDIATNYRLQKRWPDALADTVVRRVKLACCAQAEYLYLHGIEAALGTDAGGYTIGKTTVHSDGSAVSGNPGGLCPMAVRTLAGTGLLYTGVNVVW